MSASINFTLNGKAVETSGDETIPAIGGTERELTKSGYFNCRHQHQGFIRQTSHCH